MRFVYCQNSMEYLILYIFEQWLLQRVKLYFIIEHTAMCNIQSLYLTAGTTISRLEINIQ